MVLDQELMLVDDVFPCEDGHAQERALLAEVLTCVRPRDLWIADRNFGTTGFMSGIDACVAAFIIRQRSTVHGEGASRFAYQGTISTGKVYEPSLGLRVAQGKMLPLRRITVRLKTPTRDGDREIHLLTNLPARAASARKVARLYARRWTIETIFQELTETLTCEVPALGYPKAALFGFCLALLAYHGVSVLKAALRAAHGHETVEQNVSAYYLARELTQTYAGMMIAIPSPHWRIFRTLTAGEMAQTLQTLATGADLRRYQKHPRSPKKPPPKKSKYQNGGHVSAAKLIAMRD